MLKSIRLFSLAAFVSLLSACATFNRVDIQPVETARQLEQRTLSDESMLTFTQSVLGPAFSVNQPQWNIDALTLAAVYFNGDIQIAKAQQKLAAASVITAKQRPNPTLTSNFTYVTNVVTSTAPWIIGGVLNTPIETANKRDYRTDKAMLLAKAADLRVADSIWLIRSRLKAALLEAYSAQESVKLLEQHITIQTKINQLLEQQATVGEIALVEVTRARITLNQLKIGLDTAHKRIADSRVMLATIIGIPVEGLPANVLQAEEWSSVPDLIQVPVQQMKRVALHSRPDIVAALADYDAAQSALQLEIANQYPNLSLAPGYTWDLGANYWVLGASLLQLPIFNQNQGPIAEAEAKRKEMAQRFLALQLKVISDVDRANAGLQSIADKWTEVERQQQMQKKHQEEVQANYDGGEADQITLLLAKIEDIATQRSALDVLIESHQAENGLEDTLRQPMHSVLSANLQGRAEH